MKLKAFLSALAAALVLIGILTACSGGSGNGGTEVKTLKMAHNLSEDHPVHQSISEFAKRVEEKTGGSVKIQIFPNGVLGDERQVLEQLQSGGVDITKVSAGALENFAPEYAVFSLPYLFSDEEHFYKSMESEAIEKLYQSTKDKGFIGLTFYDSGSRNFYTKDRPIKKPEDLKGLKIRVMDNRTAIRTVELLGGTPTPLAYGEIYTALQQGVIDGAENNPTALTTGKHGEVAKHFSFDEHARIPDIVVINSKTWDSLTSEQQKSIKEAARESTDFHKQIWNKAMESAVEEAKSKLSVTFYYTDIEKFREKVEPLHEEFRKDPKIAEIMDAIKALE